jgi:hypothetical protein
MSMLNTLRIAPVALVATAAVFGGAAPTSALTPPHELVAHRAVYELSLATSRGKSAHPLRFLRQFL